MPSSIARRKVCQKAALLDRLRWLRLPNPSSPARLAAFPKVALCDDCLWHICGVAADTADVRLSGKTGSDRPTVKTALLTHKRHRRIPWMGRSSPLATLSLRLAAVSRALRRAERTGRYGAARVSVHAESCRLDAGSRNEIGRGCRRRPPHAQQRGHDRRTI
jgi:hypothetical protein